MTQAFVLNLENMTAAVREAARQEITDNEAERKKWSALTTSLVDRVDEIVKWVEERAENIGQLIEELPATEDRRRGGGLPAVGEVRDAVLGHSARPEESTPRPPAEGHPSDLPGLQDGRRVSREWGQSAPAEGATAGHFGDFVRRVRQRSEQ